MTLRSIIETCDLRRDILDGGLTDAHFAAQLDQVVRSPEEYAVYGDPAAFFEITYPTEGLRKLLTSTFGRLSGLGGEVAGAEHGVVRLQTSFGGGKTHGLIAAYHLASGARPGNVGEFLDPDLLTDSCAVAAVVGDALDALAGLEVNGQQVVTMWGAIAAQLGDAAWTALGGHDAARTVPGKQEWVDLFSTTPTLVVIDELADHLRALATSGSDEIRRQGKAMPAFLFNLFSAAAEVRTARVVITLATAQDAFGSETAEVEQILDGSLDTTREAESVVDRYREVLVPAEDSEISEILRRRLFQSIDEEAATAAATTYRDFYAGLQAREVRLGTSADIEQRVCRAYPFHPELVQVLDARVGTIPAFQRTRGALRLLAEAVTRMWADSSEAVIINLADLPLRAPAVTDALTRGIGREALAPVVATDIVGTNAHASQIDQNRFQSTTPFATRVSTVVFLHSLEHTAQTGATLADVWRGTLLPGDDPDLVEEALRLMEQSAWHFSYDGARYRFQTEPNPRKIVEDEKSAVSPSLLREELDRRVGVMFSPYGPIKTRIFPASQAELDDRPELQLAVMHHDNLSVRSQTASPPPLELADLLDTSGVAGANRRHRNGVVFLVADTDNIDAMREAIRYDLASQRIVTDSERMGSYAEEVQRKLTDIADKAGLDARVATTRCYRHLYYPKADPANNHLRHHEMSPSRQGEQENPQTVVVQRLLEEVGKIRTTPISTDFLAEVSGFPATDPLATNHITDAFWRNHGADLILNSTIITDAVLAGIRNGAWVYYDAEAERAYESSTPPPAPRLATSTFLYTRERAETDGLLRREPTWIDVEQELVRAGGEITGTSLRAALERAVGAEPTKTSVGEVLARVLQQDPAPIVVVEGDPTKDSSPLSRSAVTKASLDRLTVLSRERATAIGITDPERPTAGWHQEATGPAGQAFATIADKLAEIGDRKRIERVDIAMNVTAGATADLRTLLSAPPMLPRYVFEVSFVGSATFPGIEGEVTVPKLAGRATDFRKIERLVLDLFDKADDIMVVLVLTHTPNEPLDPAADAWRQLADTFVDLNPGVITVTVRGR